MKFLETITFSGNEMLIPVSSIRTIYKTADENSDKLVITFDEDNKTVEYFKTYEELERRYQEVKKLLNT